VVLTVKYRIPDNPLLPGKTHGSKIVQGILPGGLTSHSGTFIDHFAKASSRQHATSSRASTARSIHLCRSTALSKLQAILLRLSITAPLAIVTGCLPTFTTEAASGLGTNAGQDWALRAFFKLNSPTIVGVTFRNVSLIFPVLLFA